MGRPAKAESAYFILGQPIMDLEQRRLPENSALRLSIDNFISTAATCDFRREKHQDRVTGLCCAIGEKIGLSTKTISGLRVSAALHDLGLLRVPEKVLDKRSALTYDEAALIKKHPQTAYQFLSHVDFPWPVAEIVLQHHEHFDGSGYPNGLAGDQIRLEAKIICVADTFEAITSKRPHRPAATVIEAATELEEKCGSFYDPDVVNALLNLVRGMELFGKGWSVH